MPEITDHSPRPGHRLRLAHGRAGIEVRAPAPLKPYRRPSLAWLAIVSTVAAAIGVVAIGIAAGAAIGIIVWSILGMIFWRG